MKKWESSVIFNLGNGIKTAVYLKQNEHHTSDVYLSEID